MRRSKIYARIPELHMNKKQSKFCDALLRRMRRSKIFTLMPPRRMIENNQNFASQFFDECVVAKYTPSFRNFTWMKYNWTFCVAILGHMFRSKIFTPMPRLHMNEKQSKFCDAILRHMCRSKIYTLIPQLHMTEKQSKFRVAILRRMRRSKLYTLVTSREWKTIKTFAPQLRDICVVAKFTVSFLYFAWMKNDQDFSSQFFYQCVVEKFTPSYLNLAWMKANQTFCPAILRRLRRSKIYALIP